MERKVTWIMINWKRYKFALLHLLLIIIFLFPYDYIFSQDRYYGIPQIDYYSRREYNAATQNWSITQSHHDILYFANNDGLLEYDGVEWKLYRDIGSYVVRSVKSIGERIYAGTFGEMGYFSYSNNLGLRYTSLATTEELKSYGEYWKIHEWNERILFQSEEALCVFENDTLLNVIPAPSRFTGSFSVNGMMLLHDETGGLFELRGNNVYPLAGGQIFANKIITSVLPLSENFLVIGTLTDGLYMWDMQRISRWEVEANETLMEANIYCATSYYDRYLVFGTVQSGVVITDFEGNIVYQIGKDKGLNNNTVLSLLVDRDGNVWGGLDNGIVRINLRSCITFLQGYYDLGTGYAASYDGKQWYLGTNQGLFTISDIEFNDPLKDRNDFVKIPGTDGQVWSLFSTENSLLCGHHLGVLNVKGKGAQLLTPAEVNGVWIFKEIPGRKDMLMAGTYTGLILLEKKDDNWQYKLTVEGFNESSRYMEWSDNGKLWISHGYQGVFGLEFSDDYSRVTDVKTFSIDDYPEIGPAPVISHINGELLITSLKGVFRITESESIERYTGLDEYFGHDYPERMIQDRYRNIWFFKSDNTGVLRSMEDGTFTRVVFPFIQIDDKLVPSFESVYVIDRDNILFGIEDGFAYYSTCEDLSFTKPFKLHIRSFTGSSDSVSYIMLTDTDKDIRQEIIPVYPFRDNQFDIEFAAPFFREGEVEYSTYLSDYDNEATSWTAGTSRQFARLPEGDYEFMVKARNAYGVQSGPVVFRFRVLPPWYRTLLAKIIYLIIIILAILLIIYIVKRRFEINREKEKIKNEKDYRVREEKLKNEALEKEREIIRMRNERLRREMSFKEKELANSTMNILQKNDSLTKIKNGMLEITRLNSERDMKKYLKRLISQIERDIDSEDYWKIFEVHLEQVHEVFLRRLSDKHPDLTSRERNLSAYIRMGMSSKEIAALTNISYRAVENNRYRLRQKLNLRQGQNMSKYLRDL